MACQFLVALHERQTRRMNIDPLFRKKSKKQAVVFHSALVRSLCARTLRLITNFHVEVSDSPPIC